MEGDESDDPLGYARVSQVPGAIERVKLHGG
jgi:hypothetical protein